jgi:hypothetical protein
VASCGRIRYRRCSRYSLGFFRFRVSGAPKPSPNDRDHRSARAHKSITFFLKNSIILLKFFRARPIRLLYGGNAMKNQIENILKSTKNETGTSWSSRLYAIDFGSPDLARKMRVLIEASSVGEAQELFWSLSQIQKLSSVAIAEILAVSNGCGNVYFI